MRIFKSRNTTKNPIQNIDQGALQIDWRANGLSVELTLVLGVFRIELDEFEADQIAKQLENAREARENIQNG